MKISKEEAEYLLKAIIVAESNVLMPKCDEKLVEKLENVSGTKEISESNFDKKCLREAYHNEF